MTVINSPEHEDQSNIELPKLDELNQEVLDWEVHDMFSALRKEQEAVIRQPEKVSISERRLPSAASIALARVREKFVNHAEFKELRLLCDVLTSAAEAMRVQKKLHKINEKLHILRQKEKKAGLEEPEKSEKQQLRAERKLEVSRILPFNHKLRELIDTVASIVDREELENWLEKATKGSVGFVKKVISGMCSEVAVARLARTLPEVKSVRLSTQIEDAKGTDIIVILTSGREIEIDVKTGGAIDIHGTRAKEVSIEQSEIKGFDVSVSYREQVIQRIRDTY